MKKNIMLFMIFGMLFSCAHLKAQGMDNGFFYNNNEECCESDGKYYVEFFSGANFVQSTERHGVHVEFNTGYLVSGSMGYRWSNGLRLEAEYGYRRNSVEKVKFHGVTHHPRDIHFQSSSVMVNALWNMDLCQWGCDFYNITPIIGVGIGYDWERFTIRHGDFHKSHKKDGFAWQVIAGLSYPIYCNTDLSIEYRVHQGRLRDLYNHTIGLGLNYQFDLSCF